MVTETAPATEISRINIAVAEIKKDIGYIRSGFDEMKSDVRNLKDGFISRGEYVEFKASEYAEFKKQIAEELARKVEYNEFSVYTKGFWVLCGAVIASLVNSVFDLIRIKP